MRWRANVWKIPEEMRLSCNVLVLLQQRERCQTSENSCGSVSRWIYLRRGFEYSQTIIVAEQIQLCRFSSPS